MSEPSAPTSIERLRLLLSRMALAAITVLLVAGLAGADSTWSIEVLAAACALLIAVPIVNVVAVFAEEVRSRDWPFVASAAAVLLLLAYTIVSKL